MAPLNHKRWRHPRFCKKSCSSSPVGSAATGSRLPAAPLWQCSQVQDMNRTAGQHVGGYGKVQVHTEGELGAFFIGFMGLSLIAAINSLLFKKLKTLSWYLGVSNNCMGSMIGVGNNCMGSTKGVGNNCMGGTIKVCNCKCIPTHRLAAFSQKHI